MPIPDGYIPDAARRIWDQAGVSPPEVTVDCPGCAYARYVWAADKLLTVVDIYAAATPSVQADLAIAEFSAAVTSMTCSDMPKLLHHKDGCKHA